MSSLTFNRELAIALYQSSEDFPVDFDLAWQWLGYTRKDNAKRILVSGFEHGIDFSSEVRKTSSGGRPTEFIMLSIDCFKSLGMMAGTEQGKAIRKYFLECERIAKASIKQNNRTAIGAYQERVEAMFDAANKIPDGYWCVLHESANLLIWVESKLKYPVDKALAINPVPQGRFHLDYSSLQTGYNILAINPVPQGRFHPPLTLYGR